METQFTNPSYYAKFVEIACGLVDNVSSINVFIKETFVQAELNYVVPLTYYQLLGHGL